MKSLRVKAWFKATPRHEVIDFKRVEQLGPKNLKKLVSVSRKHKTSITIIPQTNEFIKRMMVDKGNALVKYEQN